MGAVPELAEQAIHLVDALLRRMHILQERRAQAFEDTAAGGVVRRKIGGELPFREPGIRQKERDPEGARLLVGKLALPIGMPAETAQRGESGKALFVQFAFD